MQSQTFKLKSQVVKAGAGTGKTTALIKEIFKVYNSFKSHQKREPNLIVCTFTIKATQELREKLYKETIKNEDWGFLDYMQSSSLYISTIDGILNMFLKSYSHKYGLNSDLQVQNTKKDSNNLIIQLFEEYLFERHPFILEELPFFYLQEILIFYVKKKLTHKQINFFDNLDFQNFNKERKQILLPGSFTDKDFKKLAEETESFESKDFIPVFNKVKAIADDFFKDYLQQKKQSSKLTIEDFTLFSLDLLRTDDSVAKAFSKEWDYWFIDEYQDTSWIQEQIFKKITGFKNVFCVGDPKQSIYLFRGADPQVFTRRVEDSLAETKTLDTNYRSHNSLIHFFNEFFKSTEDFTIFKTPNENNKNNKDTRDNTETSKASNKNNETTLQNNISFLNYEEKDQAFHLISQQIQIFLSRGVKLNDIAILSRKNKDLADLQSFLKKKKINTLLYGSNTFYQNRLILDSLFLLKFLINPYDSPNLIALFRTPYFRLSDSEITKICYHYRLKLKERNSFLKESKVSNNAEAIDEKQNKQLKINNKLSLWTFAKEMFSLNIIKDLERYLKLTHQKSVIKVFEQVLLDRSFMDLAHYQDSSGSSESNLWGLLFLLKSTDSPLDLFYSLMDGDMQDSVEVSSFLSSQSVQMMTIHKSKGLEFKHVIIYDLSIGKADRSGNKKPNEISSEGNPEIVLDSATQKMAFAVPVGARNKKRIKSYGHKKINQHIKEQKLEERDRLFYVAFTRAQHSLTILLPSAKPEKSSWLSQQGFFEEFRKDSDNFNLKEGIFKRQEYSILISKNLEVQSKNSQIQIETQIIKPYKNTKVSKKIFRKSSKDFEQEIDPAHSQAEPTQPANHNKDKTTNSENMFNPIHPSNHKKDKIAGPPKKIIFSQFKNTVLKMHLGNSLHYYLQMLSYHPLESILKQIEQAYFSQQEKEKLQKALRYVNSLKNPDMNYFLKNGHPEWSFKFKKNNVFLQGQIDLWGKQNDKIFLFDYKSSLSQKPEKQLIFYSWILENMYQPDSISMFAVYPFEQEIKKQKYERAHKTEMETWLKTLF